MMAIILMIAHQIPDPLCILSDLVFTVTSKENIIVLSFYRWVDWSTESCTCTALYN